MGDFHGLRVWHLSRALCGSIYRVTARLPADERYGLTNQMRRAAVSVLSNIAEGAGRGNDREFITFLRVARGSLNELSSQLAVCVAELRYLDEASAASIAVEIDGVGRALTGLIRSIQRSRSRRPAR